MMTDDKKNSTSRIAIVGHFGGKKLFTDGQTVKVKSLYEGLSLYYPSISIDKVDTYYLKSNPIKLVLSFILCLLRDKKIIIFPAARGRKYMFCVFYYLSVVLKKEIYHDCIAGSLHKYIMDNPKWIKYLNAFKINWMESPEQVEKLHQIGINNAVYLPNFKHIMPVTLDEMNTFQYARPYKFCTFSRVEPQKGIEDALKIIQEINIQEGTIAKLDVFGPIQSGSENWFEQLKNTYKDLLNYKGIVDPHDSVDALKKYFALLFPTQYYLEGMPGTIIDAMFAGLPVIARRWAWCDNMIKTGYNGISYDFEKPELLKDILLSVINQPNTILSMKENCLKESEKYSEKKIVDSIAKTMMLSNNNLTVK